MEVLIDNRQNRIKIHLEKVNQAAQAILNALDCPDGELSILLVDDPQITELNKKYLNRSGPTNVIAFPMREGRFSDIHPDLLGDVVISMDTTENEAVAAGLTLEDRFNELLIHGILHLFGYDHETNEKDAALMATKAEELSRMIQTL